MSIQVFQFKSAVNFLLLATVCSVLFVSGCSVEAAKKEKGDDQTEQKKTETVTKSSDSKTKIEIKQNSPADTVRAFFADLRGKQFREAIFLTNLRPAIEGLTESELKDLQVDFESLAQAVSADIEINGEIVAGDNATVTAKIPDPETGKTDLQQFHLRKQNDYWTILTVDEAAEKVIQKEGKNYFFNLRIETHQAEAKKMIERISQAQLVHALQNQGVYADLETLVAKGLLSADAQSAASTGYSYMIAVGEGGKNYAAAAIPAEYGKTGKLSYLFETGEKSGPKLTEKDNGGKLLTK